ncbi:galactonate dehydratase [Jiangella mangrovi]
MKITRIETFTVPPRWLFLRIETDDGVVGWGEPVLEGRAATVAATVDELSDQLVGRDPLRIEDHWQVLTKAGFYRGGPVLSSAVAGIDQALWDIAGRARGASVHELLGGPVRERVRIYAWVHGSGPEELADQAAEAMATGLTAVKFNGWDDPVATIDTPARIDAVVARVAAVRAAIGQDADLAIDFHGRFSPAMARRVLPLLEEFHPLFVEEPVVPELSSELVSIAATTSVPIATGERLYSRWDFRDVLASGIAVAQPDLSHAGGVSECRRIAAMAEIHGVSLAPHCPLGPIALAACLQVDLATPNFLIQEQALGLHDGKAAGLLGDLVDPAGFSVRDGYVERPMAPGLGLEIDEKAVRRVAQDGHRWRAPIWRHPDGSLAEW